jgi:glyoxylase-like metal-dependent hydrolase (beta-lactamase superfamily II)
VKNWFGIIVGAALSLVSTTASAQAPGIETTQLTDQLYLLSSDQGSYTTNTIALVGDDGILLVDTQAESDAPALKQAVDSFGMGIPTYIINTHRHVEHVGGNAIFGHSPVVIAHDLVPSKLRSGSYIFDEFPDATFPDITLTDSLTLYFNDERIRLVALPGSHDDNEIIVHFTESKVVHLSSLVNGFNFPSVDSDGDVLRFPELVGRAIALLPEDVVIVSGHNDTGTWHDLHSYREMLLATTAAVRDGMAAGKDLATLQAENVLEEWDPYAGSYVSTDAWTEYLYDALNGRPEQKRSVFESLYYTWKEDGAAAAVEQYFALKLDHFDEYRFDKFTLLAIGNKLLGTGHVEAAVQFLDASLRDYPQSDYAYYTNYQLANAHERLGNRELALRYCRRSLELNAEFGAASQLLERLEER